MVLNDVNNAGPATINKLKEIVKENMNVFQRDFPGYSGVFGEVKAYFEFASSTKPIPPDYTPHAEWLFYTKCLEMKRDGVLVFPEEIGVTPQFINNSWLVLKPTDKPKSFNQCTPDEVRVVVGYNALNRFVLEKPSKITKSEKVFADLARWKVIGQMDIKDCFWQILWKSDTAQDKHKQGYLCVLTPLGTMVYTHAPQGLLGSRK